MDIQSIHDRIRQLCDAELAYPFVRLADDQIDLFLDMAQRSFVQERFVGSSPVRPGIGFEMDQKRTQDLRNLVVPFVLLPITDTIAVLPDDYWFTVALQTKEGKTITEIKFNQLSRLRNDPFSRPAKTSNVYVCYTEQGIIVTANSGTDAILLSYLRKPIPPSIAFNVTLDLPDATHMEIIKMTVRLLVTTFEPSRQTQLDLQKVE